MRSSGLTALLTVVACDAASDDGEQQPAVPIFRDDPVGPVDDDAILEPDVRLRWDELPLSDSSIIQPNGHVTLVVTNVSDHDIMVVVTRHLRAGVEEAMLPMPPFIVPDGGTLHKAVNLEDFGVSLEGLPTSAYLSVKASLFRPGVGYAGRAYPPTLWAHAEDTGDFFIYTSEVLQRFFHLEISVVGALQVPRTTRSRATPRSESSRT